MLPNRARRDTTSLGQPPDRITGHKTCINATDKPCGMRAPEVGAHGREGDVAIQTARQVQWKMLAKGMETAQMCESH